MDTYSSLFYKEIVLPAISAMTFTTVGGYQYDSYAMNHTVGSTLSPTVDYHCPYSSVQDVDSNQTIAIYTDIADLMVLESFATKILDGILPVEASIQAVIDDYFWEML